MLLALSGGQKLGLLLVAGVFICFALAASFVFPRSNPDWPGPQRLRLFVVVCAALVVAMMGAMFLLAREDEAEAGGHGEEPALTEGAETEGEPTEEEPAEEEPAAEEPAAADGDPDLGKDVFVIGRVRRCHTLAAAGSNGMVGPNLDEAQPSYDLVVERVTNGMGGMPSFKDQLSEEEIQNVAAYVSDVAGSR